MFSGFKKFVVMIWLFQFECELVNLVGSGILFFFETALFIMEFSENVILLCS